MNFELMAKLMTLGGGPLNRHDTEIRLQQIRDICEHKLLPVRNNYICEVCGYVSKIERSF